MSRKSVVTDWRGASFAGVDFAKFVTSWSDNRDRSGTNHTYNKRDGGEGEDMGREPFKSTVHCAFIGPTWRTDFLKVQNAIDDTPIATFVHPVYGAMTAWARSSGAGMDVENSPNFYDVTFTFEESQVDTKATDDAASASQQGPEAKGQAVSAAAANLAQYAPLFATAASAVTAATSAATGYAAAAVASAAALAPDPTLPQQLASALSLTSDALDAISADLAAPGAAEPAIDACESLYDACAQLDEAVKALRPQLSEFETPMTMHITALALSVYGPEEGPQREAEIMTNNVGRIPDPAMIPAGTKLMLAPRTSSAG